MKNDGMSKLGGARSGRPGAVAARSGRLLCMLAAALTVAVPSGVRAANSCNSNLSIDYLTGPNFALPGDVYRVKLTLGAGTISGGTQVTVSKVLFDLDCNSASSLSVPCTDDGALIEYEGDGTITTTCTGVTFTTGHGVSDSPNEVQFTATPAITIPMSTPAFCEMEFDVKVLSVTDPDPTPSQIQEAVGYEGMCNNGLASSGGQSGSIAVCPSCQGTACADSACNQSTGQCAITPKPDSTPCPDTDGDLCTIPGCNGTIGSAGGAILGCDQHHQTVVCPPDGNPCTDDLGCNPQTGLCQFPPTPDSTPCPDTDNDPCTTAGCDGQGVCDQRHIVCVTTTTSTTNTTSTTSSTTTTTVISGSTTTTIPLDHFQCYEVDHVKKSIPVTLVNQFGTSTATLVNVRRLCNPADKNGEDPAAPGDPGHLVGYTLRQTSGRFTPVRGLRVTNQFGTFVMNVLKPLRLLVPSSKSVSSPPPPLDSATAAFLDHFECYKASGAPGAGSVTVQDEFGTGQVKLLGGKELCVPVDKNGGGIPNPAAKLLCYKAKQVSGSLHGPSSPVFVNNQFGPDTFRFVKGADELCVPSSPSGAFLDGGGF